MEYMKISTLSSLVLLLVLLILGACSDSTTQEGAEWLREPDSEGSGSEQYTDIPMTDIYEVTASKVALAFTELEQASIVQLSPQSASWYTGHYYTCPPDKQAYLVRAVYAHAGTGAFNLKRLEDDLLIIHQSLGHSTIYQKSALVVNLDYTPEQLFIRVTIAE